MMSDCIDNGSKSTRGYKTAWVDGYRTNMHRVVCAETHGLDLWDTSWQARHTCDNRRCINPDHLIPGTAKDNTQDMMTRDRHVSVKKLTDAQIEEIKKDPRMQKDIAAAYGVSRALVSMVKNDKYIYRA